MTVILKFLDVRVGFNTDKSHWEAMAPAMLDDEAGTAGIGKERTPKEGLQIQALDFRAAIILRYNPALFGGHFMNWSCFFTSLTF